MADNTIAQTKSLLRAAVERCLSTSPRMPVIFGLAGAQGSGKSTLAQTLSEQLNAEGRIAACISLDDFYLSRADRRRLAARVHPLFVTRGPPGTHDIPAALAFFADIKSGKQATAPQFDKALDEPAPPDRGKTIPAGLEVFIFEGWCLGARPQCPQALDEPINMLEAVYDRDGVWRRAVNGALGGAYQALFSEIDALIYLKAPTFEIVSRWRAEQEAALKARLSSERRAVLMRPDEIAFFIQHYERITRSMMIDLPGRADLTFELDDRRRVVDAIMLSEIH